MVVNDPMRDDRSRDRILLGTALAPHVLLSLLMLYYWSMESDPAYVAIFAWFELLLLPGGLILGSVLAAVRGYRHLALTVFVGTFAGVLPVLAVVVLIDVTS